MTPQEALIVLNRIIAKDEGEEARQVAIKAVEKQIPKKPIINDGLCGGYDDNKDYVCPICGAMVYELDCDGYYQILYPTCYCGQRIDWSEEL